MDKLFVADLLIQLTNLSIIVQLLEQTQFNESFKIKLEFNTHQSSF